MYVCIFVDFVCLSFFLSACLSFCRSVFLFVCLSFCFNVYLSVLMSICLRVRRLFTCLAVWMSFFLSVCLFLSFFLYVCFLFVCLLVFWFICPNMFLYVCLTVWIYLFTSSPFSQQIFPMPATNSHHDCTAFFKNSYLTAHVLFIILMPITSKEKAFNTLSNFFKVNLCLYYPAKAPVQELRTVIKTLIEFIRYSISYILSFRLPTNSHDNRRERKFSKFN